MAYSVDKGDDTTPMYPVTASWAYEDGDFKTLTLPFGDVLDGKEDVMYSNIISQNTPAFEFSHALAYVTFDVVTSDAVHTNNSTHIYVQDILINDVQTSGTLTVTAHPGSTPNTTASWASGSTSNRSVLLTDGTKRTEHLKLTNQAVFFGGLLVTNQTPVSFTVVYDMDVDGKHFTGLKKTVDFITDKIGSWEIGNKYAYTITVSPNEIKFTASVNTYTYDNTNAHNQGQNI